MALTQVRIEDIEQAKVAYDQMGARLEEFDDDDVVQMLEVTGFEPDTRYALKVITQQFVIEMITGANDDKPYAEQLEAVFSNALTYGIVLGRLIEQDQ